MGSPHSRLDRRSLRRLRRKRAGQWQGCTCDWCLRWTVDRPKHSAELREHEGRDEAHRREE